MVGKGYMSPRTFDDIQRSGRAYAQKQLDRLVAKAKARRVRARGFLYEGMAADAIVRSRSRQARRDDRDGHARPHRAHPTPHGQRRRTCDRHRALPGADGPGQVTPRRPLVWCPER